MTDTITIPRATVQQLLEALLLPSMKTQQMLIQRDEAIIALRRVLEQQQAEPVAWGMAQKDGLILDVICPDEHESYEGEYTIPLYTAPPQRSPLTDEEIRSMCKESWVFETVKQWVRIIEAAHGIQ